MAAGYLSEPGTSYGPCLDECKHTDCAETRAMAATECYLCNHPIGYERGFFRHPWTDAEGQQQRELVHADCYQDTIPQAQRGRFDLF